MTRLFLVIHSRIPGDVESTTFTLAKARPFASRLRQRGLMRLSCKQQQQQHS